MDGSPAVKPTSGWKSPDAPSTTSTAKARTIPNPRRSDEPLLRKAKALDAWRDEHPKRQRKEDFR